MGRVLGVEIVVLSSPPSILLVGRRDLEDHDLCLLHKAQEPCAVAAGRLDSDALKLTEGKHPGEHLAIALPGRGEGACSEDPILLIDYRCDVKILMGIDAADNVSLSPFDDRHSQPPDCHALTGFTGTECADRTVTRPWHIRSEADPTLPAPVSRLRRQDRVDVRARHDGSRDPGSSPRGFLLGRLSDAGPGASPPPSQRAGVQ